MKKLLFAATVLLASSGLGMGTSQAQPDVNNAPKGANPPNRERKPKPTRAEQIAKRRARKIEARITEIRLKLNQAGFTDEMLQATIVGYYKAEQEARAKISEQYARVVTSLKDKKMPDAQLVPLLAELRTSIAAEKLREEKSFADFSAKLKLAENPRLDALLMTQGVTGSERALASQASGVDNLVNALAEFNEVAAKAN